jgi:hypothetical protein
VLKNEFMEFTAIKAQANGTVGLLTGSIKLLSDNLNVLFAATAGLMTLKLAGYFLLEWRRCRRISPRMPNWRHW